MKPSLADEVEALRALVKELEAENARLLKVLKISPHEAKPPGPTQTGWSHASSGPVHAATDPSIKVAFFAAMFAARTEVYATRWENSATRKAGYLLSGADGRKVLRIKSISICR